MYRHHWRLRTHLRHMFQMKTEALLLVVTGIASAYLCFATSVFVVFYWCRYWRAMMDDERMIDRRTLAIFVWTEMVLFYATLTYLVWP